jgi:hypothetical protein
LNYKGPARIAAGNPTTRKPYDEGYLVVDQNNALFHIKMVNGKPFIKKTPLPDDLEVAHISPTEKPDRRFYGFLFDKSRRVYFISTNNYKLVEVPVPYFNYKTDYLQVMVNLFYWNVSSTTNSGKTFYAINANSMQVVDSVSYNKEPNRGKDFSKYIFPAKLEFASAHSGFIQPKLKFSGFYFIYLNVLLLIVYLLYTRFRKKKTSAVIYFLIAITGVFGLITSILITLKKNT